jgi:protein-S-isoprenylcysteine O-methyltransferase Ste14
VTYLFIKAAISGMLIALASEVARKFPGFGALIASLPLISVLGMMWLWRDTQDAGRLADHAQATLWFVLPSLPMFVLIPVLLRRGVGFWPALALGCLLTVALYLAMVWAARQMGIKL